MVTVSYIINLLAIVNMPDDMVTFFFFLSTWLLRSHEVSPRRFLFCLFLLLFFSTRKEILVSCCVTRAGAATVLNFFPCMWFEGLADNIYKNFVWKWNDRQIGKIIDFILKYHCLLKIKIKNVPSDDLLTIISLFA